MRYDYCLSGRMEQILCSIVKAYIETGDPVASSEISRLRRHNLSSASVRNVMAELAAEGYLHQPHTSAGRVPTSKAFEIFVNALPGRRLEHAEFGRIRESLGETSSVGERMERCTHILAEMTQGVSITAAIPAARQMLDQVQLVSLADRRVLMIVVTQDRMLREQVVTLDQSVTQEDLNSIRNYINVNFRGWVIREAQQELRRRLEEESAAYDLILKKLILLHEKGLLDISMEPEVHMEGASNIVAFELQLTREKLKELFRALEEKKRVLQLLDRFLEERSGEVGVRIGLAEEHPSMGQLSLIGITVATPGGLSAKIAVLGPLRMNYPRAMSAVLHVGRAFCSLPS